MKIEATLKDITEGVWDDESSNWAQVFADENAGNVTKDVSPIPETSSVDLTPPSRADVAEVLASVNGGYDEADWLGVFRLHDGRFLVASGGCDYTGWD